MKICTVNTRQSCIYILCIVQLSPSTEASGSEARVGTQSAQTPEPSGPASPSQTPGPASLDAGPMTESAGVETSAPDRKKMRLSANVGLPDATPLAGHQHAELSGRLEGTALLEVPSVTAEASPSATAGTRVVSEQPTGNTSVDLTTQFQ